MKDDIADASDLLTVAPLVAAAVGLEPGAALGIAT